MLADRIYQSVGGPHEHSAVPVVVTGGYKLIGALLVGFLREASYPVESVAQFLASFNIAISRFGTIWGDAHHHHVVACFGEFGCLHYNLPKRLLIADDVVGWKHADHSLRIFALENERRQCDRWSGVARHRLGYDLLLRQLLQLPADHFKDVIVGDDPEIVFVGERQQSRDGLL